jgi:hypothetical protein
LMGSEEPLLRLLFLRFTADGRPDRKIGLLLDPNAACQCSSCYDERATA